jgi:hypothetical protein
LRDRINRRGAQVQYRGRGRKWSTDYQINLRRDARRVNEFAGHRIVDPVNQLTTPELQRRFKWRYTSDGLEIKLYNQRR